MSLRWLVVGGAVGMAGILGLAVLLVLQFNGAPACAVALAAPPGDAARSGKATYYDSKGGGGNCSFVSAPADRLYVALGPSDYSSAAACGGYLDVTGPKGKVRVLIMDQCPECPAGHLDLSKEAFAKIADPVQGVVPVTYRAVVNPPLSGPLTFRMKDGVSLWWFAVQVGNHGNPLRSVEARSAGSGWRSAVRHDYNYWLVESGLGLAPYTIRVTDMYGNQATATGIGMLLEQVQTSKVSLYAPGAVPRTPASTPPSSVRPTPTPSVTAVPATSAGTPTAEAAEAVVTTGPARALDVGAGRVTPLSAACGS